MYTVSLDNTPLYITSLPTADDITRTLDEADYLRSCGYGAEAQEGSLWVPHAEADACRELLDTRRTEILESSLAGYSLGPDSGLEILGFPVYTEPADDIVLAMIDVDGHEIICGSGATPNIAMASALRNSPSISSSTSLVEKAVVSHRRNQSPENQPTPGKSNDMAIPTIKHAPPGIISSNTGNPEHLVKALLGVLRPLDKEKHAHFEEAFNTCVAMDGPGNDEVWPIVDNLCASLQKHAPDGHVLALNPDNGREIGFWACGPDASGPYMSMAYVFCAVHRIGFPWSDSPVWETPGGENLHDLLRQAGARETDNEINLLPTVPADRPVQEMGRYAMRTRHEFHDGSAIVEGEGAWAIGVHKSRARDAGVILHVNGRGYTGDPDIDPFLVPPEDHMDLGLYAVVSQHHEFLQGMQDPDSGNIRQWHDQHDQLLSDVRKLEKQEPAGSGSRQGLLSGEFALKIASLDGHRELGINEGYHSLSQELLDTTWPESPRQVPSGQEKLNRIDPVDHSGRFSIEWKPGAPDGAVLVSHHGQPWSSVKTEPAAQMVAAHIASAFDSGSMELPASTVPELLTMHKAPATPEKPRARSGGYSF